MTGESVWLPIGLGAGLTVLLWAWRRLGLGRLARTWDGAPAGEPCWTEQISTDGRLSYGRYGCYHPDLAEMEARVRSGEFGPSG